MMTPERMAHQLSVARRVVELARERGGYSEEELRQLFVMGYVHDLGYEFAVDPDEHAQVGGEILAQSGFMYAREVVNHGNPAPDHSSPALDLLNAADMQTSPSGERVSYEERLADIAARYGEDSPRTRNAAAIIAALKEKGL